MERINKQNYSSNNNNKYSQQTFTVGAILPTITTCTNSIVPPLTTKTTTKNTTTIGNTITHRKKRNIRWNTKWNLQHLLYKLSYSQKMLLCWLLLLQLTIHVYVASATTVAGMNEQQQHQAHKSHVLLKTIDAKTSRSISDAEGAAAAATRDVVVGGAGESVSVDVGEKERVVAKEAVAETNNNYSPPLGMMYDDDDSIAVKPNSNNFRPMIPKDINLEYISQNVFTQQGQYRVFEPVESDLRATFAMEQKPYVEKTRITRVRPPQAVIEQTTIKATSAKQIPTKIAEVATTKSENISAAVAKSAAETARKNANAENKSVSDSNEITHTRAKKHERGKAKQQQHAFTLSASASAPHTATTTTQHLPAGEAAGGETLEELLTEYIENFFNKGQYEPAPGLVFALQKNHTNNSNNNNNKYNYNNNYSKNISPEAAAAATNTHINHVRLNRQVHHQHQANTNKLLSDKDNIANDANISVNIPRALETGRVLFFSGLKKILWPIYMGLQILKSLLFALFLPTLIGSFGKLLGKGISSGSAPLFIRPMEPPQDLDFKDNSFNFDDDNKFVVNDDGTITGTGSVKDDGYSYHQTAASQVNNQYAYNAASINNQALSRYGNTEQQKMQDSYLSALQSISSASFKNSNSISGGSAGLSGGGGPPMRNKPAAPANTNTFQTFQNVPASSLLLSNYDPFYSPLLSRLDSVFAQLKLNSEKEDCREKLICLMYANPAKYAPYSNLVSAQLSRELNELRKPTSDNPDILRFFKYMRAAKDGQDGIDCEETYDKCKEFKDFDNPAMLSTYNDINKLVQARKLT